MKYALIPVLSRLKNWMEAYGYSEMTWDEFEGAVTHEQNDQTIETARLVFDLYHANKG